MTVEEARIHLRTQLEEQFGVMEASILLDRPPGGWSDLATHQALTALEGRIDRRFGEVNRRFDEVDRGFDEVDRRLDEVNRRLDALIAKVDGVGNLKLEISEAFTSHLRWTIGSMIGLFAVVVGALRF